MTTMSDDDPLRTRMRAADPAATLPPAEPERVSRLLEETMSLDTPTESRATGTRRRSRFTWLVAAAAVVLIVLAATSVLTGRGETPSVPPSAEPPPDAVELTLPGQAAGRCMVPSPEVLGRAEVVFDGEVTSVSDGRVVLRPTLFYAGGPAEEVEVAQASESVQDLVLGVRFREGGRYLVAANDGEVMVCGFSGAYDAGLADLYEEAFAE